LTAEEGERCGWCMYYGGEEEEEVIEPAGCSEIVEAVT
jgi:hypothetical protein